VHQYIASTLTDRFTKNYWN